MAEPAEPAANTRAGVASDPERYSVIRRVTLVGAALDLILALEKLAGGFLAHSQALIADGVHSLSDLLTDMFVLYAARPDVGEVRVLFG